MSVSTAQSRQKRDILSAPSPRKDSSLNELGHHSSLKLHLKLDMSECENDDPLLRSAGKIRDLNCTYVLSACKTPRDMPLTPNPVGKLTLQRRVTKNKDSSLLGSKVEESTENVTETPLTLRRCARTGSVGKGTTARNVAGVAGSHCASQETSTNAEMVSNENSTLVPPSVPPAKDTALIADEKYRETFSALSGAEDSVTLQCLSHSTPIRSQSQAEAHSGHLATKRLQSKLDIEVSGTGNLHHRSTGKDTVKNTNTLESLEKKTPTKYTSGHKLTPRCGTPQFKSPAASTLRHRTPSFQVKQKPKSSLLTNKREKQQEHTLPPKEEMAVQSASPERDPLKAENSQVTVAVRVRPFSKREKAENAPQVVFLSGEEIAVRHPDMRHVYHFTYDMSFWSFDERHPQHASQATVYETLAAPLLAGALEGYNTCLFAYGQTGSGKSYTMMGFGEEPGIIPRFCEDLFAQVAKKQTQEVRYHLEMSFFEVYNEKIHDLLVYKGENGQRKQALRVREHPVSGPYVEGLAVNVVSSYSDVQGWLELGAKQRATATTSMNDKSSRSHAVLTLVATRTQTEFVDGEEHDHRITSRINLVDLAGSERCGPACASGQQLKEGVSINRSLLTLGKVISALAEHGHRRGVFIPYRESVLTWLLKESLGGNSKTAMIATVSPAASSVEETLSTLRYALQARSIVNVARVNEDMSAQLIRELKAEIEKLKAAQRSRQNIDPERYSLCRREITSLRMKLHQQERDMAEMQRVWKEKFEQAEQRKHHEIQELQKAGVTFQVDNNLPNLVNLSEDPQLSEMLLYVIKEGTTTVGKCSPTSSPDIQLSGVLVADTHCSIRNVDGTVSLVPVREANTYVNGKHVLEPTVLHHGDRVVLGGDHYFRFNHPAEVQKRRRPTGGDVLTSEGPKDFDFAKNELLKAQRSQLEAEVREAQLRAKQEMLQGVQIAREMAEQELSSQRAAYESRIEALEAELKEESQRKRVQEISNQKAAHRIEELEKAKQRLEQEVHTSRKRLEVESLAAKQALEDHSIRHTRILEALEAEKQKIAKEVQILQHNQSNRDKTCTRPATVTGNEYLIFQIDIDNEFYPSKEASDRILVISLTEQSRKYTGWHSLRLSVMVQEANAISHKFRRGYVFSRHQTSDEGDGSDPCVRVRDLRLGISTLWSLEKFEYKLAAMKELYESNCSDRGEDPFCDPEDEWEPDITDAPVSSFSRRRSRSLVRNRRVSGYLHDVRARSGQNAPPSRSSGVMEKLSAVCSDPAESFLPGICRGLIGSSLAVLGQSFEEETVVDSLVDSFLRVHHGLLAISQAHEDQDEDSQDDLFSSDRAAQAQAVQVACAFAQLVVLARHWPADLPPGAARLGEELRREVTTLGGSLQLFLQGCCSGLSAVVKEAQEKVAQTVQRALKYAGQFAVLHGDKLRLLEGRGNKGAGVQEDFMAALWDGMGSGMRVLFDSGIEKAGELRRELLRQHPHGEVAQQLSANAMALVGSLENIFAEWKARSFRTQAQETSGCQDLKKMIDYAPELLKLKLCLEETIQIVLSALRGCHGDGNLRNCVESICSLARGFLADGIVDTTSFDSCDKSHRDLESAAKSLLLCFESEERPHLLKPWDTCNQNGREGPRLSRASRTGPGREKGVPKHVYELPSCPQQSSLGCAPSRTQWV